VIRTNQRNLSAAQQDFARVLQLNPNSAVAYKRKGDVLLAAGDEAAAVADYSEALFIDPGYAEAYKARGDARLATGDVFGAIDDYTQALTLDADYLDAYAARGNAYIQVGEAQAAYQDLSRAIMANPDTSDPELYFNRGVVRANLGDSVGARRDFEQAASLYLEQGEAIGYRETLEQMSQL
jgi:tetratricopeptide (TPR) repeat protein